VLELKERIREIATTLPSGLDSRQKTTISDAIMALISLGYGRAVAEKAVSEAAKKLQTVDNIEVLVREALKYKV
ncbi:MAG: RuvA C-terminal domain-containing protein, partial [Planctomycetota bacterium]